MSKYEESMEKIRFYMDKQARRGRLSTADQIDICRELKISEMGHKLKGICALSTSHFGCRFCEKAAAIPGSICAKCYVNGERYKTNLHRSLDKNKLILDNFELSTTALKTIDLFTERVRIQAHGETDTPTCARNFIRLIQSHRSNKVTPWEKNDAVWAEALDELGKPRNMTLIHSSMFINRVTDPIPRLLPYVDHVFTVLDNVDIDDPLINCGGRLCMGCKRCYDKCRVRRGSVAYNAYAAQIEDLGLEYRGHDYYVFERLKNRGGNKS